MTWDSNFRSEYWNKLSVNANFRSKFRNELSVKANFRSKFRNELSVKPNFRSKIRVNYNNRHCENSANFLRTFALDKNSPFFVEKPRNSRISSNYVLITFSQYCNSLPDQFTALFETRNTNTNYNLRRINYFSHVRYNSNIGRNSVRYRGPIVWNLIPEAIKDASS